MEVIVAGGDETAEQRVRLVRLAEELGVKLAGQEEGMILQLDHLDQLAVGRRAAENHALALELLAVGIVEFVAMAMALVYNERAVDLLRLRAHHQLARLRAQAHRAALF